ncbi:ATP-binding protein [uncultured Bacteroides sp.]|uniref:ATP-binding protein n=1 Tax=uncultured Bacteroides sp. TaxID=162156 RepID=UPI0025DF2433|nr:ATP-binding protein [uncultured Bacteroides sp.]
MMKQIPYGITDFSRIQKENYYYVDKTKFIEKIEMEPPYLFLIRPRRFGKSLTLAMLESYYDISLAEQFDELFGQLYIGQHPTKLHNQFLIMRFNFSEISSNVNEVERSFRLHCCGKLKSFLQKYEKLLGKDIWDMLDEETLEDPGALLSAINTYATNKGNLRIYLLIDEYDNFTNTILSTYGTDYYTKATHGEGFIRGFFNVIKAATTGTGAALERLFITGVSPVTMDDVTSGFNIGTNITTDSWFNDLVGFSEKELREMLTYYQEQGVLLESVDDTVAMMKPNYDNYCFSRSKLADCMFNSDMVLYFMKSFVLYGEKPNEIVDPNIRTDFNKLTYLIKLDHGLGENFSVIKEIAEKGEITTDIVTHFSALEMTDVSNFKSLLFYFGLLSIKGVDMVGRPILHVPNLVVREQLFNFLIQGYIKHDIFKIDMNRMSMLFENMAFRGDWKPLFDFIAEAIREQSRIREYIEGEAHIKGFLLAYLGMYRYYQLYPEYELNKGFADFYFKPSPSVPVMPPFTYLLEVKYAKAGASENEISSLADEAREQLLRYSEDEWVAEAKKKGGLKLVTIVWRSWELALLEEVALS